MTELFKQKLTRKVGIVEETIALTVVRDGFTLNLSHTGRFRSSVRGQGSQKSRELSLTMVRLVRGIRRCSSQRDPPQLDLRRWPGAAGNFCV
jgi:hypothetical protein